MRTLAKLRRLFSALIGALMRRGPRAAAKDSVALRDVDLPAVPSSSSKTNAPGAASASVCSGTQESAVPIVQTLPSGEAEGRGGLANSSHEADRIDSPALDDNFGHEAARTGTPPPEVEPPIAVIPDQSTHTDEMIESVAENTSSVQLGSPFGPVTISGISDAETSETETATPGAFAMPDNAVPASPNEENEAERAGSFVPEFGPAAELISEGEEDLIAAGTLPGVHEARTGAVPAPEEEWIREDDAESLFDPGGEAAGSIADAEGDATTGQPQVSPHPRRPRPAPSERRPEPVTEYDAVGLSPPSEDYRTWNRAIAENLLLKTPEGSDLYLTITPRILGRALVELQGASRNAEQAQEHFANSVSDFYRARVLTQTARLRVLRRNGDDGLPECIGFLALTVLAAYRMRSDEEATGLAYYVRLGELLRCDLAGPYPAGFDPFVFESLWYFLRDWLAQRRGCRLVVPAPETGHRRFVGLPLAHVPLRSLDIEKLPDFFVWAGYQPSSEVTHERLVGDFARWVRARGALTPTGVAAFADARRPAVLAEIRAELDSWDGTCEESFSRRSAAVEILFDPVQQRPELFYVPRRPSGFPTRFDDGIHTFEASDDGWYGRISVAPEDGGELASGFTWQAPYSGVEFALRRAAASVISLAPSDDFSYSGFMSARGLRRGVRCAVLCREDVAHVAAEYLSHVTERPCTSLRHAHLPVGWSLFAGVLARRVAEAPAGFESIDVQANVGVIPSGGIRLGNRWTWLHGAPPRIIVTGSEPGLPVTVDGEPATVGEDGILQSEGPLTGLGAHVIQVGPLRRTVEIVEPSLPVGSIAQRPQSSRSRGAVVLALPAGRWTIVGAVPGQIARAKYGHRAGTIVESAFVPSWAIRVGPEGAAAVLNVFAGVPPAPVLPSGLRLGALSTRGYLAWATAIYDVAVRHPRIDSLTTDCGSLAIAESWKSYARCAGQIKRRVRRFRR